MATKTVTTVTDDDSGDANGDENNKNTSTIRTNLIMTKPVSQIASNQMIIAKAASNNDDNDRLRR